MRRKRKYRNRYNNQYNYNPKSSDPKKLWLAITLTTMVIVTIATVIMATVTLRASNNPPAITQPTTDISTTVAVTSPDEVFEQNHTDSTQEPTETSHLVVDEQPEDLTNLLSAVEKSYSDLSNSSCTQLVTVDSNYTNATIRLWEFTDGIWTEAESYFCYGFVGSMGTVDNMSEDISGTPRGLYPIGSAFYRYTEPDTMLDIFQITDETYWVDDPDSKYYNQRVEGTEDKDWDSAEHMADYSVYNYGFVVNYNMPAVYNAGSAIFFHIGSSPTAGCIATDEIMVTSYLSALNKELNPYILIN